MHRFLLAENPMKTDRVFILHTVSPRCLIEVICINDQDAKGDLDDVFDFYDYTNPDDVIERHQLLIKQFYDIHPDENKEMTPKYRHVLDRAWRWYRAYLEFEDDNIEKLM